MLELIYTFIIYQLYPIIFFIEFIFIVAPDNLSINILKPFTISKNRNRINFFMGYAPLFDL